MNKIRHIHRTQGLAEARAAAESLKVIGRDPAVVWCKGFEKYWRLSARELPDTAHKPALGDMPAEIIRQIAGYLESPLDKAMLSLRARMALSTLDPDITRDVPLN